MLKRLVFGIFVMHTLFCTAQYSFSGYIDTEAWQNTVYLSVVDDYRKISGVYPEQVISQTKADSLGYFEFLGGHLEEENKIYKIHVDNCASYKHNDNHFGGYCKDSQEVLFIANNRATVFFPLSSNDEMFCEVQAHDSNAAIFVKIDLLKEEMKFVFSENRSEASRKLNNKKWFKILQDFGAKSGEPLSELYIYSFLSDRSNELYSYYLVDLNANPYYDELLKRLENSYPESAYTKQYNTELLSDRFMIANTTFNANKRYWNYLVLVLLILSIGVNIKLWILLKKHRINTTVVPTQKLSKQEENILNLINKGMSNKEIAESMFISLSTVKTHVNNIFKKLNVTSREEIKAFFDK